MSADATSGPPLPEHPELREIALAMESARASGDIMDARWRTVFISSELGVAPRVEKIVCPCGSAWTDGPTSARRGAP